MSDIIKFVKHGNLIEEHLASQAPRARVVMVAPKSSSPDVIIDAVVCESLKEMLEILLLDVDEIPGLVAFEDPSLWRHIHKGMTEALGLELTVLEQYPMADYSAEFRMYTNWMFRKSYSALEALSEDSSDLDNLRFAMKASGAPGAIPDKKKGKDFGSSRWDNITVDELGDGKTVLRPDHKKHLPDIQVFNKSDSVTVREGSENTSRPEGQVKPKGRISIHDVKSSVEVLTGEEPDTDEED